MAVWPVSTLWRPVVKFQIRAVLSSEPLTTRSPSGEKQAQYTSSLWPCSGESSLAASASHSLTVHSRLAVVTMRLPSDVLLAPWQSWIGRFALFGSLLVHGGLELWALYRRRHLRIPAAEAWQLGLGLLIPVLLIPHATNVRLGSELYGLDDSYYRILYQY